MNFFKKKSPETNLRDLSVDEIIEKINKTKSLHRMKELRTILNEKLEEGLEKTKELIAEQNTRMRKNYEKVNRIISENSQTIREMKNISLKTQNTLNLN